MRPDNPSGARAGNDAPGDAARDLMLPESPESPGLPIFHWPVRVYYEDTDTGGIVFYANYLKFFERARTEWLRAGGFDQSALADAHGIIFVVMHTAVDYHAPAKLDNELKLSVQVEKCGRASVEFFQEARRVGGVKPQLLTSGRIKVACVDRHSLRPKALPDILLTYLRAAQSGT